MSKLSGTTIGESLIFNWTTFPLHIHIHTHIHCVPGKSNARQNKGLAGKFADRFYWPSNPSCLIHAAVVCQFYFSGEFRSADTDVCVRARLDTGTFNFSFVTVLYTCVEATRQTSLFSCRVLKLFFIFLNLFLVIVCSRTESRCKRCMSYAFSIVSDGWYDNRCDTSSSIPSDYCGKIRMVMCIFTNLDSCVGKCLNSSWIISFKYVFASRLRTNLICCLIIFTTRSF